MFKKRLTALRVRQLKKILSKRKLKKFLSNIYSGTEIQVYIIKYIFGLKYHICYDMYYVSYNSVFNTIFCFGKDEECSKYKIHIRHISKIKANNNLWINYG